MHDRNRLTLKTLMGCAVFVVCLTIPSAQPADRELQPAGGPQVQNAPGVSASMAIPILPLENWTAVAASGLVESRAPRTSAEQWVRVTRGDQVVPLSHVKTDHRGRATLARKGDLILVSPDSELTLPSDGEPAHRIRHQSGKAFYQVEQGQERHFEVITPYLVAGVKGTKFSVHVEEDFVAVNVVEGHVSIQSLLDRDEVVDLFEGHMITMDGRDGTVEIYREGLRPEDRPDAPPSADARRVRKETRRMVRSLSREENRLDFERLWEERLKDESRLDKTELDDAETLLQEERHSTKLDDDVQRICAKGSTTGDC